VVRQDRHQPVAGWRASSRGAIPASRDAIRPGTSQWRGCSTTVRPQVEARAGVTAGPVTAAWPATEQTFEEAETRRGRHVEESFRLEVARSVFEN
jgi:hypothetical protein